MRTSSETHACLGHCLPGLPTACIGYRHRPCDIVDINFNMICGAGVGRCHPDVDVVGASRCDIDHVLIPVTGIGPTDIVTAACVACRLDLCVFVATINQAAGTRRWFVVTHVLTTRIVVLDFHLSWQVPSCAAVRRFDTGCCCSA